MIRKYTLLFLLLTVLVSCKSNREEAGIIMNGQTLETPFSLINGIQIDELRIDTFKEGLPYVFYLREAMLLARLEPGEHDGYLKKALFFNQPNPGYTWRNDSTWGIFDIDVVDYKYRGSITQRDRFDHTYQTKYTTYPYTFKPGQWYLVDFKQDEKHRDFMYVDSSGGTTSYRFFRLKER